MDNIKYKKNREIRKLLGITRNKCKYCGCYKKGKHKKDCQSEEAIKVRKKVSRYKIKTSTISKVLKKWDKRNKYLEKLNKIRNKRNIENICNLKKVTQVFK